jgi:cation:H+ antiporter
VLGALLLVVAALLLAGGADLYTRHVGTMASELRVSALAIGLLLAGAEPEELITALIASSRHHPGIAAGDAIGANVTMLTLVLGIAALLQPLPLTRRVRTYAGAACAATTLAAVAGLDGVITRAEGVVLAATYAAFFVWVLWREHRVVAATTQADPELVRADPGPHPAVRTLLAFVGLGLVAVGGKFAVDGAIEVTRTLGTGESGVGLTFVALATSAELLALLWAARRHDVSELALAALIGSVVGNATATLGVAAIVRPLDTHGVWVAAWLVAGLTVTLLVPQLWRGRSRRLSGGILLGTYLLFGVAVLR